MRVTDVDTCFRSGTALPYSRPAYCFTSWLRVFRSKKAKDKESQFTEGMSPTERVCGRLWDAGYSPLAKITHEIRVIHCHNCRWFLVVDVGVVERSALLLLLPGFVINSVGKRLPAAA